MMQRSLILAGAAVLVAVGFYVFLEPTKHEATLAPQPVTVEGAPLATE